MKTKNSLARMGSDLPAAAVDAQRAPAPATPEAVVREAAATVTADAAVTHRHLKVVADKQDHFVEQVTKLSLRIAALEVQFAANPRKKRTQSRPRNLLRRPPQCSECYNHASRRANEMAVRDLEARTRGEH